MHFSAASGQYFSLPNLLNGASAAEVLIVLRASNAAGTNNALWRFGGSSFGDYYHDSGGNISDGFASYNRWNVGAPTHDLTQFHIYQVTSQAGLWENWMDGVPLYESTFGNTFQVTSSGPRSEEHTSEL